MLGLEVAAASEHHVHHRLGEGAKALAGRVTLEAVGEHEVDVAVFRVAEDHGVLIPVFVEQLVQVTACVGEVRGRDHDVLEECGCATFARARDGGVQAFAQRPCGRAHAWILGENGGGA